MSWEPCRNCDGKRTVPDLAENPENGETIQVGELKCKICDGSGKEFFEPQPEPKPVEVRL